MNGLFRELAGAVVVMAALGLLFYGVTELRARDYLACIILVFTGLSLMRAGIELLRPTLGD